MDLMISDYQNKLYSRATIKCSGMISSDFILTNVSNKERDIITVDNYYDPSNYKLSLQDRQVQLYMFSGYLYDTEETPWESRFIDDYKNIWKASICMRAHTMVEIKYLNISMRGYIISLRVVSTNTGVSKFSFEFFPIIKEMTGGPTIKKQGWPEISHVKREDVKAKIYRTNVYDNTEIHGAEEFILSSMTKLFRERVQITGPGTSIITFGSYPPNYRFSLALIHTPNIDEIEDPYSWDEKFRNMVEDHWRINNLTGNHIIGINYKDRVVLGYFLNPSETLQQTRNWSGFNFDFLVIDDRGVEIEES